MAFDDQLAGYIFLPLSHTFKVCQKKPGRIAESATKCLQVLLAYGWRDLIEVQLSHQLLILLTLFAGGGPPFIVVSEELQFEALKALTLLFEDVRLSAKAAASLTDIAIIPAVGQCLSTTLDCLKDGETPEIQLEALRALSSLWKCMKSQQQALSTFLPGTVSALTYCLTPGTQNHRTGKVLVLGIEALSQVLTSVIGDMRVTNLKDGTSSVEAPSKLKNQPSLTKSWLKACASQIHLALGNIIKLRTHSNADVRQALEALCLTLLDECQSSLQVSATLLVETAMITASSLDDHTHITTLKDLAAIHPPIRELIKSIAYNWATSLPRVMQGSDEAAKAAALQHMSRVPQLLGDYEYGSDVLESALVGCLKESVMSALESAQTKGAGIEEASASRNDDLSSSLTVASDSVTAKKYRPLVLSHESQRMTRSQFRNLLAHVGSQEIQLRMVSGLLEQISYATGNSLLASFWLSFQLLKSASAKSKDLDSFSTCGFTASDEQEAVMDEIYNYSVSTLSESDAADTDWRFLAVALEVVAFFAEQQQEAFKPQLVDALYPVVQLLGTGNQNLREHAVTTLNVVSKTTGYNTTSEMIVDNVDYLVNAVSLKLNTFNISPQAPRVLVMMIKLSGPSLLPYLDDVVGSIFAALDNFHGYTALVDSLFSVLGEIVDESTKSGQLSITSGKDINHLKQKPQPCTIHDLTELLTGSYNKKAGTDYHEHEVFPRKPWKTAKELLDEADAKRAAEEGKEAEDGEEVPKDNNEVANISPTKLYTMVETIARLSQHYLTSPSSHLRLRLLDLISTASGALHNNEDQFLPLLNDVWPVVIKRLYDYEPYVVLGAAKTIGSLCKGAGDFMFTRIRTEWADMTKLIRSFKVKAETERKGRHGRGVHAISWQVWGSMITLLVTILEYVRVDEKMFEDCCEILASVMERQEVRSAIEVVNADALFLMDLEAGRIERRPTPVLEGFKFARLEAM